MIYKHVQHAWRNAKNLFGNVYFHGKKLLHNFDHGVDITRRILDTAAPVIRDLGGGSELARAHGALQTYDQARAKVLAADQRGTSLLSGLRKAAPELGL